MKVILQSAQFVLNYGPASGTGIDRMDSHSEDERAERTFVPALFFLFSSWNFLAKGISMRERRDDH